ncbi:DNA primase [Ketogulonicigenium robustum]|uniref:DNA primase n=1 Tax=Ketogulonicigenium robustum TaxID=92947 RepID=A0A1W6NZZ3_9RHOB|nr:DNA primase [Ketogulonicigenium robustum]
MAQVVGRKVVWDRRKSNPGKGDMWAPCPFHQEKSASFHVDDRKGYYYCFGCHAKGDAISFVRETENVGFAEAVEILAREAGMQMPARDPQAQQRADRRTQLADVMEQAVQVFRMQLKTQAGEAARAYLQRRGLSSEAWDRWGLGFAPDNRTGLLRHLTDKGVAPDLMVDAGLVIKPDDGGQPYDRFRGRIIFPIRDARGRAISLGGRAMDPNARAKYLNGPETALFDKGRSLFNIGPAREAAGKGHPLIVAEGYMDVIALSEAGFHAAVAPLGTAVTADQLALMWRIADEPIIALDGDTAGLRAALRVIDLALPLLEAGKGLRFAIMPEGQDPDDLIKAKGRGAMQAVIDGALPMVRLMWQRETDGKVFDSPERRAALDKQLRALIRTIRDPSIKAHYGEEINRLRQGLFGTVPAAVAAPVGRGRDAPWTPRAKGRGAPAAPGLPTAAVRASILARNMDDQDSLREAVILATVINCPAILPEFETELERMACHRPDHQALRGAILRAIDQPDLRDAIVTAIGDAPLERLFAERHVAISPAVRRAGDIETARMCLAEELAKLNARRGHAREIEEALEDWEDLPGETVTFRLGRAAQALDRAGRGDDDDKAAYEIGANGARLNRDELDAFDALLARIDKSGGAEKA